MIFDTHAHYDDEQFDEDREELLSGMQEAGIGTIVNVGSSIQSSETTLELAHRYPFIYGAVGVHPDEVGALTEEDIAWLKSVSVDPKIVAIGEIGLDYYWNESEPEIQKQWFIRQLDLAREVKLPVIIHSREAARDTLDIMKEHGRGLGGVIHCFSYGVEIAREYLNMDYYLGVGGVLTFKNARKLKEVVEYTPMERIVLETDCPYLAPVPNRGKRNSSMNLPYVVEAIAEIKGISKEDVIWITEENARKMYKIQ
jgi:TatD DNase family protein